MAEAERNEWLSVGQEAAVVNFHDSASLLTPFCDAKGIFLMIPPNYNARAGYAEARHIISSFKDAIASTRPPRLVGLSSIGGHRTERLGLIEQSHIFETELGAIDLPVSFLRPAWFMENAIWQIPNAESTGTFESYLAPLTRTLPMAATADIGIAIADLLLDKSEKRRTVEIEGPNRYSPADVALELGTLLGRDLVATLIPRPSWHQRFLDEGSADPGERIAMLDGFNSGWIDFEGPQVERRFGIIALRTVLEQILLRKRQR